MEELRLAFLTPEHPATGCTDGGLARYVERVTAGLVRRGHEVEVFVPGEAGDVIQRDGVRVEVVGRHQGRPGPLASRLRKLLGRNAPRREVAAARALAEALETRDRERRFDLVQASNYGAVGLHVPLRRRYGLVTRCSYYYPLWREAAGHPLDEEALAYHRIEMRALRRSDGVFTPSRWLGGVFRERESLEVEVVESPFQLEVEGRGPRPLPEVGEYLLHFGTLSAHKGVHLLAEALPGPLTRNPGLHVILVGKDLGWRGRSLVSFVREGCGSAGGRVHWLPPLSHAELFALVRGARVVVLPSLVENLPHACMEAMALGALVVCSRGVSFDELVEDGVSGLLFERGDAADLGRTLERALALPSALRESVTRAAARRVERLSPERTLPALEGFYRRVLDRRRRGPGTAPGAPGAA